MIPYGLFSQISLIVISVAILFTYIKPSFEVMGDTQDKILTYQEEIAKVSLVNQKLQALVSDVESVSSEDHRRLLAYMPDSVDSVSVPRDLQAIASEANVLVRSIEYEGPMKETVVGVEAAVAESNQSERHTFKLSFEGSYDQIKRILQSLEANHYPLEVREMTITKVEGGFLNVDMNIMTYDSMLPSVDAVPALQ